MMLGWIFRKWNNRGREIFRFWDGTRWRRIDPMVVYRGLVTHPEFDVDRAVTLLFNAPEEMLGDWVEQMGATSQAVRDLFDVPGFEEGGLTEAECTALLMDFIEYTNALKKNGNPPPTSRPSMEPQASEPSTMSAGSDSTSTADACDSREPQRS